MSVAGASCRTTWTPTRRFEGYVTGSNKGGLLVNVEGVNAFVPLSQIVAGPERGSPEQTQRALTEWVGKNITLKVIELNRRRNRAILSERAAVQERRAAEKERLLLELTEGDVKTGRITSIRDFGIFVDIGGADGLVHLSELSWERTPRTPQDLFKVGDEVQVYVLKVDQETKKIALSVRRAQPERWEEIVSRYREGQIVAGQVTKLAPFGAFVKLEGPIEGLIHISELVDRRINHPKEVVDEGDVVPVKIVRIEYDRHRLGLSLRQAKEKAEEDGWTFSDSGRTLTAPADVLESFGVTEATSSPPDFASAGEEIAEAVAAVEVAAEIVAADAAAVEEAVEQLAADEEAIAVAAEVVAEEEAIVEAAAEAVAEEAALVAEAAEALPEGDPDVEAAIESVLEDAEAVAAAEEVVAEDKAALEVAAAAVAVEEAIVEAAVEAVAVEEAIVEEAAAEVAAEAEEAVVEAVAAEEEVRRRGGRRAPTVRGGGGGRGSRRGSRGSRRE